MKKAQGGVSAGVLIILITVALILYILFLPPDVRDDLLNDGGSYVDGDDDDETGTLMSVVPGRIDYVSLRDRVHQIPNFRIDVASEPSIIASSNSMEVVNSAFTKKSKRLSFEVNPNSIEELSLTFNVDNSDGKLIVELNGDEIINKEVKEGNAGPFIIRPTQASNELIFFVDSPGWFFLNKHEYSLSNIRVSGEIKDFSNSEAIQTFSVSEAEYNNLERAELKYLPYCNGKDVETLTIYLNGETVFRGVPDCGIPSKHDVDITSLNEGSNSLQFISAGGSYIVDAIELRTYSTDEGNPLFFFDIKSKFFDDDGELLDAYDVHMDFTFTDDDSTKNAEVVINDGSFSFRTRDEEYSRNIDDWVEEGTNRIEIIPDSKLDIARLKVILED